jgi:hypothetical protein
MLLNMTLNMLCILSPHRSTYNSEIYAASGSRVGRTKRHGALTTAAFTTVLLMRYVLKGRTHIWKELDSQLLEFGGF